MINQFLLICFTILTYEFIKLVKLRDIVKSNLEIYRKIIKLVKFKEVSDFRKEKLMLHYSKLILIISIKILCILLTIMFLVLFFNQISKSYINLIISFFGIFEITIILLIYHKLKKLIYAKL